MSTVNELKIIFEQNGKLNNSLANFLKKIEALDQHPVLNVHEISATLDKIRKISTGLPAEDQVIKNLNEWVNLRSQKLNCDKKELTDQFGSQFAALLKTDNLELKGQYPDLKVKFYTTEIDFFKNQILIWYGPKQELLSKVKVDVQSVYRALKAIDKSLYERELDETLFLQEIHTAYMNNISKYHLQEGSPVEILSVLKDIVFLKQDNRFNADPKKDNFTEYGRASFSYDLFRLSNRTFGAKTLTLDVATRMKTATKSGFLWIPENNSGDGFACSHLAFKEVS